ncbi:fatty acid-binding protein, liver-like [Ptychodera flava]|uniref:fatty acid-binding protein, liver-like n=1 Tax=Ptychodera flava TaxID=63121 RepID=UPI00396A109F
MASIANFSGKWKFERHENSEALFAAMGIPEQAAKVMVAARPTLEIYEEGSFWVLKETADPTRPHFEKFKLGEATEITTMFGKRKIIASLEGGQLITRGTAAGDDLVAIREVNGDQLVARVTKSGVTGICYFSKA